MNVIDRENNFYKIEYPDKRIAWVEDTDVSKIFNNTVQEGPFKGMVISEKQFWGQGDKASKILGLYEKEIQDLINLKLKIFGVSYGNNERLGGSIGPMRSVSAASREATDKASTKSKRTGKGRMSRPEMESLEMIEWESICRQVASFAETPRGAQLAYSGKLYIGKTVEESIDLLQQTKEALDVNISFDCLLYTSDAADE